MANLKSGRARRAVSTSVPNVQVNDEERQIASEEAALRVELENVLQSISAARDAVARQGLRQRKKELLARLDHLADRRARMKPLGPAAAALMDHDERCSALRADIEKVTAELNETRDATRVPQLVQRIAELQGELSALEIVRPVLERNAADEERASVRRDYDDACARIAAIQAEAMKIADRISKSLDQLMADVPRLLGMQPDYDLHRTKVRSFAQRLGIQPPGESQLPYAITQAVGFTEHFFKPQLSPLVERMLEYSRQGRIRSKRGRES